MNYKTLEKGLELRKMIAHMAEMKKSLKNALDKNSERTLSSIKYVNSGNGDVLSVSVKRPLGLEGIPDYYKHFEDNMKQAFEASAMMFESAIDKTLAALELEFINLKIEKEDDGNSEKA